MRCTLTDRPVPLRTPHWLVLWVGCLSLWVVNASAAENPEPADCSGQVTSEGCARPAGSERSEAPDAPPRKRTPRSLDTSDAAPGGSIAPESRRVLPA